jgi:SAM-dependent methyltransferase
MKGEVIVGGGATQVGGPPQDPAIVVDTDLPSHITILRDAYPHFYKCLDVSRVLEWQRDASSLNDRNDDFGPDGAGGRGTHYINAQTSSPMARSKGIEGLLRLITRELGVTNGIVLDLLGGDGLVHKVANQLQLSNLNILTCDISEHMVQAACDARVPAIHQRAERLLCKDGSVDGVLLAYGTHHIDPSDRSFAFQEAHRVLRPGGVFVIHDFEVGGPMDKWFGEVVDIQSRTGHPFRHFARSDIADYFSAAGFKGYRIIDMTDSYCAVGDTPEEARLAMGEYLIDMYGLVKVEEAKGRNGAAYWALEKAREIFGHTEGGADPTFDPATGIWRMEVPRSALVGVAIRRS